MKNIIFLLLFILLTGCVKVYNEPEHVTGVLTLSSSAELMVVPDEMSISFGIEKYDASVKRAREATSTLLQKLVTSLKELGVDEKKIEYGRISITPRYPENEYGKRIIGYYTSLSVTVKLNDFDKISDVVDKAVANGVNSIGGFHFYSTKMPEHKKKVRSLAIDAAKDKAKQYEKEMGLSLGKLIKVEENSSAYADRRMLNANIMQTSMEMEESGSDGQGISPGEIPLRLHINCEYEIVK